MLIGHWPLIGNTNDYSGFNNNGTPTNVTYVNGKIGQAGSFNGTSSLVTTPLTQASVNQEFTISAWVYPESGANFKGVVGDHLNFTGIVFCQYQSGPAFFTYGNGTAWVTIASITLPLNTWHHVTMVLKTGTGGFGKVYLNGVQQGSTLSNPSTFSPRNSFLIGRAFNNSDRYWDGRINDVRVYNHALSEYEVKELAKAKVTHLPLNGHSLDVAGYLYDGTPQSATSYTTNSKIYSEAFQNTDGGGNKAITIANGTQNITGDQTIAMWLFPTSFAARRNPWNKAYGGEGTITQEISGGLTYFWGTAGGNAQPYQGFGSNALTLNQWNHIALVRDLSATTPILRWYINGVQTNTATPSYTAATATTSGTTIGAGYTSPYHGRISDVRQYGTALSANDILALYNKRGNFDNLGNATVNEYIEYQEPIISTNLILNLDANDKNSVSPIGCTGFNTARPLVTSTVNTSSYTITSDANIRLGNLDYYTAFAIDHPEGSYGGDAANRHGITPGFNVRSGAKLYDASRALHMWVFNNNTNSWLPSSFFNGSRLSGHCYDTWTGFTNHLLQVAQFVTDYNNIKSQFKSCTFIIMGSHRDSSHTTDKINVLLELGAPSNVSSLLTSAPEYILIGEPGLGAGNAYSWAYENYTTDPTRVAHTNFGLPTYGRKGNYFDFSLSTNFISVADNALLDIVGDKTLACWVYMGADSSGSGIVAKANGTVNGMALAYGWSSNGFQGIAWNSSNTPAIAKDLSRDIQKWCYLTVTQSGSTRTIYVYDEQGLRTANSTAGVHTWNNTLPLYIGGNSDGASRVPNGTRIAMVSVYDRALTAGEVLTNFNNTKTNFYNDGNKNTINTLGQGTFSEFVEGETLATTGVKQAITNNGTLVINGEFSEVD